MSDEYTPTTEDVENCYVYAGLNPDGSTVAPEHVLRAEFDRWVTQERAQQARFWMRVTKDYCWLWTGETATNGYGRANIDGRNQPAHRVAYEWLVGPVPDGLELDHLCAVRNCVNPVHLEPVTHQVNVARAAAKKRFCPRGHSLSGENLVPSALRRGKRDCLACSRERAAKSRQRKKESNE